MKTSDFYYDLPPELIAQTPLERRDASRLMTLDRVTGEVVEVKTNTPAIRKARRVNLELLLSNHDKRCLSCVRSTNCATFSSTPDHVSVAS